MKLKVVHHWRWRSPKYLLTCGARNGVIQPFKPGWTVVTCKRCRDHDYRWPRTLSSGVMFFDGYRITIDEFNAWAEKFFDEAPTRKKRSQCDCERFDYCRQHGHAP
jgi:hypothetical protein